MKAFNQKGEKLVKPNTSVLEGKQLDQHMTLKELVWQLLIEQRITNAHLQIVTDEEIGEDDVH